MAIFTEIMETPALLLNLRTTAMHGLFMICVSHPSAVRKNPYFQSNTVPAYMRMLAEPSSLSLEEWCEELNDEIISKNDISLSTE
jgi:hypothetical protein